MKTSIKALILQDYLVSGHKDLGSFALSLMDVYDDLSYELKLIDCIDYNGNRLTGKATAPTREGIQEIIQITGCTGDYKILEVDCQKEFFNILAEIRDDLKIHKRYTRSKSTAKMEG